MHHCGAILGWIGRRSTSLVLIALVLGALGPDPGPLRDWGLPAAVVVMTLGSFLAAGLSAAEGMPSGAGFLAMLGAVWIGPAILAVALLGLLGVEGALATGILLSVIGPPAASSAAMAALLGLQPRLALWLSLPPLLLAPLGLPALAALVGGPALDIAAFGLRVFAIVGTAALLAALLLVLRRWTAPLLPSPRAAAGVSVIGLFALSLFAAHAARDAALAQPEVFPAYLALAFGISALLWGIGALPFAGLGAAQALTVGLTFGVRNQSLAWASVGTLLPATAEIYLIASVIPSVTLPLLVRMGSGLVAAWRGRRRRHAGEAMAVLARTLDETDGRLSAPGRLAGADATGRPPTIAILKPVLHVGLPGGADPDLHPDRHGAAPGLRLAGDLLADALATELTRRTDLLVIARQPAPADDPCTVAADVGADFIVASSLARVRGMVRAQVVLVDGQSGCQLWAERYDRPAMAADALDDVAVAAANALGGWSGAVLCAAQRRAQRRQGTLSGHDHYALAVEHEASLTLPAMTAALDHCAAAQRLVPEFARAHLLMHVLLANGPGVFGRDMAAEMRARGARSLATAFALDDRDPMTLAEMARMLSLAGDGARARAALDRAIELGRGDGEAMALCAMYAATIDETAVRARACLDRSEALCPRIGDWRRFVEARVAFFSGDYAACLAVVGEDPALLPLAALRPLTLAMLGRAEAQAAHGRLTARYPAFDYARYGSERPMTSPVARARWRLALRRLDALGAGPVRRRG